MIKITVTGVTTEQFVKRAFFLLWKACGGTAGMGFMQNRPQATEDDVWKNVMCNGDYEGNPNQPGRPYGDYVFGRMMKWGCQYDDPTVTFNRDDFTPDYQAWCRTYKDTNAIIAAVIKSFEPSIVTVSQQES